MPWSVVYRANDTDVVKHTFDWVSDGSGAASVASSVPVSGTILRVSFIPSATAVPTTLYDVVLNDADGFDVLAGQGANLSETTKTNVCPGVPLKDGATTSVTPMVVDSILTLVVSNAGASKAGKVIVYVR